MSRHRFPFGPEATPKLFTTCYREKLTILQGWGGKVCATGFHGAP
jgi:hypothetical protein